MLIKLLRWFSGYLLVGIRGYSPERFINLCSSRNILIWSLTKREAGYEFYIGLKGYKKIRPIAKKTKTRPVILERKGLPFLMSRYKKRKIFFLGIILCAGILYCLSLFLWNISISGEYSNTNETIRKYLEKEKIHVGMLKSKVDCKNIEEAIRREYEDIGWVSAEVKGTRLLIKLTETNLTKQEYVDRTPSHIIASRDGIITEMIVRNGTPKVKIGDVVKKGDIVVSGILELIGDSGEVVKREAIAADGDITMKSFYNYKDTFPMEYIKKVYTGEEKKGYSVYVMEQKINLFKPLKIYNNYDIIENKENLRIGRDFYLPLIFSTRYYKEYTEEKKVYTQEEALLLAAAKLDLYQEKLMKDKIVILDNGVSFTAAGSNCIAEGKLIVEVSKMEKKPVEDNEWKELETNEHSGD